MPDRHARLSPSAGDRCLNCPPSLVLNEKFPDEDSPYAAEGTVAHKVCELKLKTELTYNPTIFNARQKTLDDYIEAESVDKDMQDFTDDYVGHVLGILRKNPGADVLIEQEIELNEYIPGCFGTADCLVMVPGKIYVIDFKYGKHVAVSAIDNTQLKLYALGAVSMFSAIYNFKDVELVIIQPRNGGYSNYKTTVTDLQDWASSFVVPNAALALSGGGVCEVGKWCTFCKAKAICRAYGDKFDVTADYLVKPAELSPEEIAERLARFTDIEGYAKAVKAYALTQCLTGEGIPGYKAVEGRGTRVWTDGEAAFKKANEAGFTDDLLYERVPLSLAKVEKLMGKKLFADELGIYVYKTKGAPTLAPESDKREVYQGDTPADDFKGIEV